MKKPIYSISVATNLTYVDTSLTMLLSLFLNNRDKKFNVQIYTKDDFPKSTILKLKLLFFIFNSEYKIFDLKSEYYLLNLDIKLKSLRDHVTSESFIRLLIPYLNNGNETLYLDGDLIVIGSLNNLLSFDIEDKVFAGVTEGNTSIKLEEKLGILQGNYVNGGVLKINLINYRLKYPQKETVVEIIENWDKLVHPAWDQDIINDIFRGEIELLNPRYNCVSPEVHNIDDPIIVHFTGGGRHKPWNFKCKNKFVHKYWKYRFWVDPVGFFNFYKSRLKFFVKNAILVKKDN
jgi:lipopolysaccharide biosynthesis glycosyltransferase